MNFFHYRGPRYTEHRPEWGFTLVCAMSEPDDLDVDFWVFALLGMEAGTNAPLWCEIDTMRPTTDIDAAEVFASGTIKWDGRAVMKFGEVWHTGSRLDLLHIGYALARVYAIAAKLNPRARVDDGDGAPLEEKA